MNIYNNNHYSQLCNNLLKHLISILDKGHHGVQAALLAVVHSEIEVSDPEHVMLSNKLKFLTMPKLFLDIIEASKSIKCYELKSFFNILE